MQRLLSRVTLSKPNFTRAWVSLPKYICWKIWEARNKEIFEGEASRHWKVATATKSLWVTTLLKAGMNHIQNEPLNEEGKEWAKYFMVLAPTHIWITFDRRPHSLN